MSSPPDNRVPTELTTPITAGVAVDVSREERQIRDDLQALRKSEDDVLKRAVSIGNLLKDVKAKLGHGRFTTWIEDKFKVEFGLSYRTAARYIRLAENEPKLKAKVAMRGNFVSINEALRLIDIDPNDDDQGTAHADEVETEAKADKVEANNKKSNSGKSKKGNASDTYDKVEELLIEKLTEFDDFETAEAAIEETYTKLRERLGLMKRAAEKLKKAA